MSTQKAKFELFQRLQNLGFTYDEACQLRRIEMTLHRWSEAECNGDIYRCDDSGKPCRSIEGRSGNRTSYPVADREAGALRRLAKIVLARNSRGNAGNWVYFYHQGDPRGCALYLLTRAQLGADNIESVYTRGVAVCAQ